MTQSNVFNDEGMRKSARYQLDQELSNYNRLTEQGKTRAENQNALLKDTLRKTVGSTRRPETYNMPVQPQVEYPFQQPITNSQPVYQVPSQNAPIGMQYSPSKAPQFGSQTVQPINLTYDPKPIQTTPTLAVSQIVPPTMQPVTYQPSMQPSMQPVMQPNIPQYPMRTSQTNVNYQPSTFVESIPVNLSMSKQYNPIGQPPYQQSYPQQPLNYNIQPYTPCTSFMNKFF